MLSRRMRLYPKSPFSHLQFRSSSSQDLTAHQFSYQELNLYDHLLETCLRKCKKIQTRQLFDRMPKTLNFSLMAAKRIHAQSLKFGISSEGALGNSILDLYAKCGHMDYARKVFLHLERRNELAWNSIMSMKSRNHLFRDVMEDFISMWSSGVVGNQFSFAIVLSTCAKVWESVALCSLENGV